MRRGTGIIMLALVWQCSITDVGDIDNLNDGYIYIIGHGGSGFQEFDSPYPTNSLTSITRAIDGLNADGVEVDVQMSADSVLILYHDAYLQSQTDGEGPVWQHRAKYVTNCRYRRNVNTNLFQNEYIIRLETILQRYRGYDPCPLIFLDIKLNYGRIHDSFDGYNQTFARAVAGMIMHYGMKASVYVESVSIDFLNAIQNIDPEIMVLLKSGDFMYALDGAVRHGFFGIEMSSENISAGQVRIAHENGVWVALQGVKYQTGTIEAIGKHPEVIQTDNILMLQQILF